MNRLFCGDCREVLPTLAPGSAQLVVTSPPYNVGFDYADAGVGDRLPLAEYQAMLAEVLTGLYRVLRPGGVLAVNVPPTIRTEGARAWPLAAWLQLQMQACGFLLREPAVWVKGKDGEAFTPGVAVGAASNPFLRPACELWVLASKDDYRIPGKNPRDWAVAEEGDRYLDWLKDVWFAPPGKVRRGDPLAFPERVVRFLVRAYSCPGDVVVDPFAGTGTTGRVAITEGRAAWLIERQSAYWPRLEAIVGQSALVADQVA